MFAINFKQAFPFILAVLLIGCIFPTGVFAQQGKIKPAVLDAVQAQQGKIEPAVLDAIKAQETVAVIIYLQERPNREIAPAVKAQFSPNIVLGRVDKLIAEPVVAQDFLVSIRLLLLLVLSRLCVSK